MKYVALVAVMFFAFANTMDAQIKFGAGPEVGIAFSSVPKPLNDYYGSGFGFGVHGDVDIIKYFAVALNLDYRMFPLDKTKLGDQLAMANGVNPGSVTVSGLTVSDFSIMVNGVGKIPLDGPVTPYGVAGLGMHFTSSSDPTVTYNGQDVTALAGFGKGTSESNFGIDFGAGAEVKVTKTVGVFLDFRYILVFSTGENTSFMPITAGATFYF
jgi:opacity protein-like surface antigen